jgi:predicted DNA-binding transcriptional regulator YafY
MPEKKDAYSTPAMKVLRLYILLLFSGKVFSLSDLARKLQCSKQTVIRMIEQISRSRFEQIESWVDESGRRFYRARTPATKPRVALDVEAIQHLLLCRDIVWHLLPPAFREEISQTIAQTTVLLPEFENRSEADTHLARAHSKGSIDYSPFQHVLETALEAIAGRRICQISYRGQPKQKSKELLVAPLKLIAYRDGLYLKCRLEKALANPEGFYDPVLAIHRIGSLGLTDRVFEMPKEARKMMPATFGFIPGKPFRVEVAFQPQAARYVAERIWSDDQKILQHRNGGLTLQFTASSRQEVISWVLSFGKYAELLVPADLRLEFLRSIQETAVIYVSSGAGKKTKPNFKI